MGIPKGWRRDAGVVCCAVFLCCARSGQAHASVILSSHQIQHKMGASGFVQHLGPVNVAAHREFTIVLKPGTSITQAQFVASYLHQFGLSTKTSPDSRFIHASGTYAAAGAASGVGFERVKAGTETFVRTTGSARFPFEVARYVAATSINPGVKAHAFNVNGQALVVGPQSGYSPSEYGSIYDINSVYRSGVDGKGAVIDFAAMAR